MTNDVLADINRQTRDRLAGKAALHLDDLAEITSSAGLPAARLIGALRSIVEQLRDTNADDVQLNLRGMATRFDIHAVELAESDDYEGAKLVIECAEAFARRQDQIDASAFREPRVDRGAIR